MDANANYEWIYEVKETYIAKSLPAKRGIFVDKRFHGEEAEIM